MAETNQKIYVPEAFLDACRRLSTFLCIQDVLAVVKVLQIIWNTGGWGSLSITFKDHKVDLVKLGEMTIKPEMEDPQ